MIDTGRQPAVHDQVLVEGEVDGKKVGIRAVVVNVLPAVLWLGLVRPDSHLAKLTPEQPLQLTFRRDGAGMVAASTFLSHMGASRSRLFSVEWPGDVRLVQRRLQLRMDTECPLSYVVVSQSATGSAGMTGDGVTRNLSAGGVQFRVKAPPSDTASVGDQLELTILIGSDAVPVEAEVVRVEEVTEIGPDGKVIHPSHRKGPVTLIAAKFVSISEVAEDCIIRHMFAIQRMRREGTRKPG